MKPKENAGLRRHVLAGLLCTILRTLRLYVRLGFGLKYTMYTVGVRHGGCTCAGASGTRLLLIDLVHFFDGVGG